MHGADEISLCIRRYDDQNTPVGVDVVGAVLRVVFRDDDCHVFPVGAV